MTDAISLVIPSYNRAAVLEAHLPNFLSIRGVTEVVVVVDGSTDRTEAVLARVNDERLRVVVHDERRGQPAARNTGVEHARAPWVLFLDDDCLAPPDYALALLDAAGRESADIVGAPWIHAPEGSIGALIAAGRAKAVETFSLTTHPSTFPAGPLRTPFMPGCFLVRRDVAAVVGFDAGYRGNAWREETSFFIAALQRGHVCVIVPDTACFQRSRPGGGNRGPTARYEVQLARNNWRFLRLYGGWLRRHGYARAPLHEQARFLFGRWSALARGWSRARLRPQT